MGKHKEAVAEREKALSLSGGPNWRLPSKRISRSRLQRRLAKLAGRPDGALQTQLRLSYSIAESYMRMDKKQKAFEWLRRLTRN